MAGDTKSAHILTPYFLDDLEEDMLTLAGPNWQLNMPNLSPGTRQERMVEIYASLRDLVCKTIIAGEKPVSVAGDYRGGHLPRLCCVNYRI